jgi:nicotinate-nucleotide adenylyltransferase
MRIGVYGGSFNPPHIGHLILAQTALDLLRLDRVMFVPAFQSPFKPESDSTTTEDRVEMLSLALSDHPRFDIAMLEVERKGRSYTVDTLRQLQARLPEAELILLMGADAFMEFPLWKDPGEIVSRCRLGVACRPGHAIALDAHPYGTHASVFDMPEIGVSSSALRAFVNSGRSIRYLVPWAVGVYIESKELYR